MSYEIPETFREMFADNFRDVVQQKDSRLMKSVQVERGLVGSSKQVEFVEAVSSSETTGQRFRKTTLSELDVNGRWYYPREFDVTTGESKFDEKKLAPKIMGNGKHIAAHNRAFLRDCDSVIMTNLVGTAYTGKNGETSTALPAGQTVDVDYVSTGSAADSGLTIDKLIEACKILGENEAWNEDVAAMGEGLWCVIDSAEEARLRLQANKASGDRLYSKDFGGPPQFDDKGFLTRWGALNFITYNNLTTETVSGAGGNITGKIVPVYTSSALEFGIWDNITTTVDRRADLSNAVQFLSQYSIGAGREQEEKVVRINVKSAAGI
jgi:hypothetical protein